MEYKEVRGIRIPVLGLGTSGMGGVMLPDYSHDQNFVEAIRRAIKSGITHIDTAELYGKNHTEELVGQAISDYNRKKLFITTKVSPQHLFTKHQIISAAKNSLKRLGLDYIDLYLVHWPPIFFSQVIKNVMSVFDQLVEDGLVKFIGVSNFSISQFQQAQKFTKNKIITNQVEYSLLNKNPERELLDFCKRENVILTAYSPLGRGKIPTASFQVLDEIARKYRKTRVQVALRYLLDKPHVIAIPKATSEAHLKEILRCLGWHLKKKDEKDLRELKV